MQRLCTAATASYLQHSTLACSEAWCSTRKLRKMTSRVQQHSRDYAVLRRAISVGSVSCLLPERLGQLPIEARNLIHGSIFTGLWLQNFGRVLDQLIETVGPKRGGVDQISRQNALAPSQRVPSWHCRHWPRPFHQLNETSEGACEPCSCCFQKSKQRSVHAAAVTCSGSSWPCITTVRATKAAWVRSVMGSCSLPGGGAACLRFLQSRLQPGLLTSCSRRSMQGALLLCFASCCVA
jgi:hypothetical protein